MNATRAKSPAPARSPVTKKSASATPAQAAAKRRAARPKSAASAPAPAVPVAAARAGKPATAAAKPRKPKIVRDSFTIPKTEYAAIDELKLRAAREGQPAKKSELLRAGLMALSAMPTAQFVAALRAVPPLKTGRPAKG